MSIDKALNEISAGDALEMMDSEGPDIEIILDEDGGATVEIGDDEEISFDANLAEVVDDAELGHISSELMVLFDADKTSRGEWEQQYSKGLELLGFKYEERTKPFKGASGVAHPMLSEAVVQFQAQATKELMPACGPVRSQVLGKETVEKLQQAQRVSDFMNYQITTVMEEYTPEFDQAMFYTGYGGSTFKKVYYDYQKERMVSKLVLPDDLYIPYAGSSVMSECPRITHRIAMSDNDYRKRVYCGEYLDLNLQPSPQPAIPDQIGERIDKISGILPSTETEELFFLEFQVDLDLPGFEDKDEDDEPTGIKLPYVVTIEESQQKVVAIRRNWRENDPKKQRKQYFVHYTFIEGLGSYGLGLVHLIGGLSRAATGALRQLLDAGTLANLPAGFKAKGARIMNDDVPLQPGEWRDMDAGGAELTTQMLPLPYKEPSQTLFQLLGFSVEAGQRLANTADMQVGDGNQYAAVGTTIALLERGSMVMSAIHRRLHYAQKIEFKLLAEGFAAYLPDEYPYDVPGASRTIKKKDFDNMVAVLPVADPNIFSTAQRVTLAQTQLQLAQSAPQMHNMYQAFYRMYSAMNIRDIDSILRPQRVGMPKDPATENADVLDGMDLKAFAGQLHDAHIVAHLVQGMSPILQGNPMAALSLQKHVLEHIRLKAEEEVEAELFRQYGVDPDRLVSAMQREAMVATKVADHMQKLRDLQQQLSGEANQTDPLVEVKKMEVESRAKTDQAKLMLDEQEMRQDAALEQQKIASTERIAMLRAMPAFKGNSNASQKGK
jgi:hypothetical protein